MGSFEKYVEDEEAKKIIHKCRFSMIENDETLLKIHENVTTFKTLMKLLQEKKDDEILENKEQFSKLFTDKGYNQNIGKEQYSQLTLDSFMDINHSQNNNKEQGRKLSRKKDTNN